MKRALGVFHFFSVNIEADRLKHRRTTLLSCNCHIHSLLLIIMMPESLSLLVCITYAHDEFYRGYSDRSNNCVIDIRRSIFFALFLFLKNLPL